MFDRGAQHHHQRLEDTVREEITALLEGGLADPRIGLVTVNVVELMPKGKTAHIYVSVAGTSEEADETLEALRAAKGYIRHELALRLQARKAPDLMFHLDRSDVIEKKLDAVREREKRDGAKNKRG
jgi:ribosome-binding factor A